MKSDLVVHFHNHFYPESYIDELSKGGGYASVNNDDKGRLIVQYTGDYNVVANAHVDLNDRLKAMRETALTSKSLLSPDRELKGKRWNEESSLPR